MTLQNGVRQFGPQPWKLDLNLLTMFCKNPMILLFTSRWGCCMDVTERALHPQGAFKSIGGATCVGC